MDGSVRGQTVRAIKGLFGAWPAAVRAVPLMLGLVLGMVAGCEKPRPPQTTAGAGAPTASPATTPAPAARAGEIVLIFPYGSEKKLWIDESTKLFNAAGNKTASGKSIRVDARAMGSGDSIDEVMAGRVQAHIISPASQAFIKVGNAQSRATTGADLVGPTQDLCLSPVVIAMWKPMAQAIGWGSKPVGWGDILSLAKDPRGWAALGSPQWGSFKFGHTHPQFSNSGLISVIAETYAATGKVAGLTVADVQAPKTVEYVTSIEKAVVHYGESTGFFGRKMFENGPSYLSAAVLYENMVIESYGGLPGAPSYNLPFPVVAVYPKEGTFWSDHPVGVVQRPWVTAEHQDAAKQYIDFLLAKPQQERAMSLGFRPSDVNIPLGAPVDEAHGVNPKEPTTTLEVPAPEVIAAVIDMWKVAKKKSDVVLVLDTSGSMKEENRLENAKGGATELLTMLGDEDTFSLLTFSNQLSWAQSGVQLKAGRADAIRQVGGLFPQGGTALYDAIADAHARLSASTEKDKITAIVVLTDGADTDSKLKLDALLARIKPDGEKVCVRIFTIAYGKGANKDILKRIADTANGKAYEGKAENIRAIFKEIATFF